jgi:hypothetical protein
MHRGNPHDRNPGCAWPPNIEQPSASRIVHAASLLLAPLVTASISFRRVRVTWPGSRVAAEDAVAQDDEIYVFQALSGG